MGRVRTITANGDYDLGPGRGLTTIAFSDIGDATIELRGVMSDGAAALTFKVSSGTFDAAELATLDAEASLNVSVVCDQIVAHVTGWSADFTLGSCTGSTA